MTRGAIPNAMQILCFIAEHGHNWRIREISNALGISKSTVHRVCKILAEEGILEFDLRGKEYHWGSKLMYIAQHVYQNNQIRQLAPPFLRQIVAQGTETAILGLYDPRMGQYLFVEQTPSPQPILYKPPMGVPLPIHAGAGGKAIMAFLPEGEIEKVMASGLSKITDRTIAHPPRLKKDLAEIKRNGYAFSYGEVTPEAVGIGSPIFNGNRGVIGSLVVTLPAYRFREDLADRIIQLVKDASEKLSRLMGFPMDIHYPGGGRTRLNRKIYREWMAAIGVEGMNSLEH